MTHRFFFAALLFLALPTSFVLARSTPQGFGDTLPPSTLTDTYESASASKPLHILIVPGHEPQFGGAVYQGVYERELTVEISDQLATYLEKNPKYDVMVARTNESWSDDLDEYFNEKMRTIQKFVVAQKKKMARLVHRGEVELRSDEDQVDHATAPTDVALRLYGINKWASEHDIDLVVHVHINDAPDHGEDTPSQYSGFAVYVPDSQFGNGPASKDIGGAIADSLGVLTATSTLPGESTGVVEDQELIALGANNTLSVPSVLVEYSYITEPRFLHPEVRTSVTRDFAYRTYLGIQKYFGESTTESPISASLPAAFAADTLIASSSPAIYALQAGLHSLGYYPTYASSTPANVRLRAPNLTDCPIDGVMGACTTNAIEAFQIHNGWETTGLLGPKTRAQLMIELGS